MSTVHYTAAIKSTILNAIKSAIDAGGAAATIKVYTGAMPATPETAVTTQTLLGTLTFSYPCGTVSGAGLTMDAITQDSSADATGSAAWARILTSAGAAVKDIDCSITGGSGALQLNTPNIVEGGPILITSFVVSM